MDQAGEENEVNYSIGKSLWARFVNFSRFNLEVQTIIFRFLLRPDYSTTDLFDLIYPKGLGPLSPRTRQPQGPPKGYYNIGDMLSKLIAKGVEVRSCLTCTKTRGLTQEDFIEGAVVGKTIDLARWVAEDGKVMVF